MQFYNVVSNEMTLPFKNSIDILEQDLLSKTYSYKKIPFEKIYYYCLYLNVF